MSKSNFIQFVRDSEESEYLQENHPNAFLLLCLIAKRARRLSGNPDGLQVGEAYIGDYKKSGIESRSKYRTAIEILQMRKHITISETCRTRKNSTTGVTTVGTLVKLIRSDVWDINQEDDSHLIRHRVATESPPSRHEQERTRKKKNEKETTTTPTPFRPSVRVVALFDCLRDNTELSEADKFSLMKFDEKRILLALEYSKQAKIKTTLIQTLMWHCALNEPPPLPSKQMTPPQNFANHFNETLKSQFPEIYKKNLVGIPEKILTFPDGMTIGLHHVDTVRKDIEDFKRTLSRRKTS